MNRVQFLLESLADLDAGCVCICACACVVQADGGYEEMPGGGRGRGALLGSMPAAVQQLPAVKIVRRAPKIDVNHHASAPPAQARCWHTPPPPPSVQLPRPRLPPVGAARQAAGGAASCAQGALPACQATSLVGIRCRSPLPSEQATTWSSLPAGTACQALECAARCMRPLHVARTCLPGSESPSSSNALQDWGVTHLCFESDTEPYAKQRWVLLAAVQP